MNDRNAPRDRLGSHRRRPHSPRTSPAQSEEECTRRRPRRTAEGRHHPSPRKRQSQRRHHQTAGQVAEHETFANQTAHRSHVIKEKVPAPQHHVQRITASPGRMLGNVKRQDKKPRITRIDTDKKRWFPLMTCVNERGGVTLGCTFIDFVSSSLGGEIHLPKPTAIEQLGRGAYTQQSTENPRVPYRLPATSGQETNSCCVGNSRSPSCCWL